MNKLLCVVLLGSLAIIVAGCGSLAAHAPDQRPELPLLDKEIPAKLETTTFALG